MKKIAALVLVLVLALSAVSAFALTPAEVLGTWYTGEALDGGNAYLLTGDYHVEFNRDSTATLVMNGQEKKYTWKLDGDLVWLTSSEDEADQICFTYEEDHFKAYITDFPADDNSRSYDYIFSREQPEAFKIPDVIAAEKEEDFFGEWSAEFSVTPRGVAKVSESDAAVVFKVEFAQITKTEGEDVKYALTTYADGKLQFNGADLGLQDVKVIVELAEDGYARVTADGVPAEEYNFYMVKADAAEEPAAEETKSE